MPKKAAPPKRRTKVKDLPSAETKLNEKEMKKIKGGFVATGVELVVQKKLISSK